MMYIPAFDPFAACYRMLHILAILGTGEVMEADRLRILDYYLMLPVRVYGIRLRNSESAFRALRRQYVPRRESPYCVVTNERRLFERMRPYQMTALHRLAACGLISPGRLLPGEVSVPDAQCLAQAVAALEPLPASGRNVIAWLDHCFRTTPLAGEYGLKYRTQLMEYKYDGQ